MGIEKKRTEARNFINGEITKLLGVKEVEEDKNLIEQGMSSIQIMQLSTKLRQFGLDVPFSKMISKPLLKEWNELIDNAKFRKNKKDGFTQQESKKIDLRQSDKSFDLTDVQQAYWIGREQGQPLGGVGCHAYLEFDGEGVDSERLKIAWNVIQKYHPMLRAKFLDDGKQMIMKEPYDKKIEVHDFRTSSVKCCEEELLKIREQISHRRLAVEKGQVAGLSLSLLPDNKTRLHIDVDLLVADVQSLSILIRDLANAYTGENSFENTQELTFKEYLLSKQDMLGEENEKDKEYWENKIKNLPKAPSLPLAKKPEQITNPKFSRRSKKIDKDNWKVIKNKAAFYKQTPSMFLLTCYALILERWCNEEGFLLNLPLFNRTDSRESIQEMVADFTNLLLVEFTKKDKGTFLQTMNNIKQTLISNVSHSSYSGVEVQRDISIINGENDLVAPVVFACNIDTTLESNLSREAFGNIQYMISQTPQVWLDFQTYIKDGSLILAWDAVDELFPKGLLDDMFESLVKMIEKLATKDDWDIFIDVFPENQLEVREEALNDILPLQYPDKNIYTDFIKWVNLTPHKVALINGINKQEVTYKELYKKALHIATNLRNSGIKPGDCVGIVLPRGLEQIESMLGILLCGGVYVPVGINQPVSRREKIYNQIGIKALVSNMDTIEQKELKSDSVMVLDINETLKQELMDKPIEVKPKSSAYIIMTSGSTGMPKGVDISHASAVNTIDDINEKYKISQSDSVLAVSAIDFDLSVYDIFGLLSVGGTIVILEEDHYKNPSTWFELIEQYHITIWNSVPILLDMLVTFTESFNKNLPIRVAMLSGDWIPLKLPSRFYKLSKNISTVVAMGGGTEASIWSNYLNVPRNIPKDWVSIPYGRPLKNQIYKVVDENGRTCADWVSGELWIGGVGVALGYRGDPKLTKQKFVKQGAITWYRTGDMGRIWNDGTIEFLGRKDTQVKIKGHRIELGEIESSILKIKEVDRCKVVPNDKKNSLHAFVIVKENEKISSEEIRDILKSRVLNYMVPDTVVFLNRFPLNKNNKIDSKKLLSHIKTTRNSFAQISPNSNLERKLLEIYQEVFATKEYTLLSNFFEMGGDSLVAIKINILIKKVLGYEIKIVDIFTYKTIQELAQYISNKEIKKEVSLDKILENSTNKEDLMSSSLTGIQHSYWVSRKGYFGSGKQPSNCYFEIKSENLNLEKLSTIINALIKEHKMLKTVIDEDGTKQRILKEVPNYVIREKDIRKYNQTSRHDYILKKRKKMLSKIADPSKWPPFVIDVTQISEKSSIIHFCFDNIFLDALSIGHIMNRINELYNDISQPDTFKRERIIRNDLKKYEIDTKYWEKKVDYIPKAPKVVKETFIPKLFEFERLSHFFNKKDYEALKKIGYEYNLTVSNIILSAFSESLYKWTNDLDYTINITTVDNSANQYDFMGDIGDYTTTFLNEIHYDDKSDFYDRTKNIQDTMIQNIEHLSYSGIEVLRALNRKNNNQKTLMPVVYTSTLGVIENINTKHIGEIVYSVTQTPNVYLDCQTSVVENQLMINWDYLKSAFDEKDLKIKFDYFIGVLKNLIKDPFIMGEQEEEIEEGVL
ncbi:non-ribosomal peptide synthetase [Tepidibacter hydrothermalis]|uniref:Amino acid adenylation domain-containing protein n=1 Tax=Tepidibacter hydrothermalis TaxID=3036126 RepID=A0ABY8EIM9_9FIRM|nr:non-ribosomal peptide synthetase [Tepidibacter hydrothermalis]WFD11845.1 amino acid adenylation domain-containing protein [Tepidibacter hydrothermalis]